MLSPRPLHATVLATATVWLTFLGCGSSGSSPGTTPPGTGGSPPTGGSTGAGGTGVSAPAGASGGSRLGTGGANDLDAAVPTGTGGAAPDASADSSGSGGTNPVDAQPSDGGVPAGDAGSHPPFTGPMVSGRVTVMRGATAGRLPPGFAGLSFEKSHLTDRFFTGTNAPLIALFKLLGPGNVRFGGHDVDSRHWQASAQPVAAGQTSQFIGTVDVDGLADFMAATGWKTIYGLNLQSETTATNAVAEAAYVTSKLGPTLHSFEIGNEWGSSLEARWRTFADAIKAAVPAAQQTGPGACCGVGFPVSFAQSEASRIIQVTYHHYVGVATDPTATAALLLSPDNGLVSDTKALVTATSNNNIRDGFRWGEINTFAHHGKAGVSDAYVSALWGIDNMLTSAQLGAAGVNYHGGGQNMDGNNCPNGPASCTLPFRYSPITESNSQVTAAAPLFYGMLFVSQAGTGPMFQTNVAVTNGLNVTAYTIGHTDGSTSVVIVNKDSTNALNASVDIGVTAHSATARYLQGPALNATSGVTFAGSGVSAAGAWQPKPPYALPAAGNVVTVLVPPTTAVLVDAN